MQIDRNEIYLSVKIIGYIIELQKLVGNFFFLKFFTYTI